MTLKEKARAKVKELDERMAELNALYEFRNKSREEIRNRKGDIFCHATDE